MAPRYFWLPTSPVGVGWISAAISCPVLTKRGLHFPEQRLVEGPTVGVHVVNDVNENIYHDV